MSDVARASERLFGTEPLFSVVGDPVGLDGARRLGPAATANGRGDKG